MTREELLVLRKPLLEYLDKGFIRVEYLLAPTSTSLVEIMPAIFVATLAPTMARTRAKVKTKMTDEEKEKSTARKSGPSWLNKGCQLGLKANVPMFAGYWEPTHHEWRVRVCRPRGWRPFNVNKVVGGMKLKTVIGTTDKLCRSKILRRHHSSSRALSMITPQVYEIEPANRFISENRQSRVQARRRRVYV
ncbi:uncharacterized protein F5Z01DRAFT_640939 [Emericellopsis atlantica]|uniref:Uncharacterized protein n=1 Tax=Emericellopsis atlantica TaxID=2614577 RepID=A0A9P8CJV6_9HYPO|nr:uncharacterized protein F5Z01DRAFT_640939 [Emericellopsis atlantica]KAG9249718.1 hypothetical protein F5Z01DRAFT_640939 [Emericellopsis atlantica]